VEFRPFRSGFVRRRVVVLVNVLADYPQSDGGREEVQASVGDRLMTLVVAMKISELVAECGRLGSDADRQQHW
jgi:hypothetical protein